MKFEREACKITETLQLKSNPIAGRFSDQRAPGSNSEVKMSICRALREAKHSDVVVSLSKENCTCPGGRHFTGLEIAPMETFAPSLTTGKHKVYDSTDTALTSIRKQPQPKKRGDFFILGPLGKSEEEPDLIFLFVNPAQAERMLGLASFRGSEPFAYYPASSICSTITNVLDKKKPEINLIAMFERRAGRWSQNELILAMPFRDFKAAVENIPHSGYGSHRNQPT